MAKTHRQIEDESMRLVGDGSNLSKGGEDYDAKYKKLLEQYGLERKETDFEKDMKKYGPSIKEGMKKSREANAARAATNAARAATNAARAATNAALKIKAAEANTHRAREDRSMQPQTEVKASKGGYVEAETRGVAALAPHGAASTREKPKEKVKVKRRVATLAPHGAASTKEKPSAESTITPKPRQSGRTGGANKEEEARTKTPSKKRVNFYTGGPEWRQAIKRTLTAPLRLVARVAEEQEKKKKGSRFGSPYQLRTK